MSTFSLAYTPKKTFDLLSYSYYPFSPVKMMMTMMSMMTMMMMMVVVMRVMLVMVIVTLHYPLLLCFLADPHSLLPPKSPLNVHLQNLSQSLLTTFTTFTICHNPAHRSAGHLSPTGRPGTAGRHRVRAHATKCAAARVLDPPPPGMLRAFLWFGFHCFGPVWFGLVWGFVNRGQF